LVACVCVCVCVCVVYRPHMRYSHVTGVGNFTNFAKIVTVSVFKYGAVWSSRFSSLNIFKNNNGLVNSYKRLVSTQRKWDFICHKLCPLASFDSKLMSKRNEFVDIGLGDWNVRRPEIRFIHVFKIVPAALDAKISLWKVEIISCETETGPKVFRA
jgi:hypothetical protein